MSLGVGVASSSKGMGFDEKNGVGKSIIERDDDKRAPKCMDSENDSKGMIITQLSETSICITDDEDDDDTETKIQLGPQFTLKELSEKDKDDESLRRWKEQLLGSVDINSVGESFDPEVKILSLAIKSPGRSDINLPIPDGENPKGTWFTLKEGSHYSLTFTFKVSNNIVSGLKYKNSIWKTGIRVDSRKEMIGTFSPQTELYTHEMPDETTPSGIFARGSYTAKTQMGQKKVVRKRKHESAKDQPKDQTQKKMNKTMMTEQTPKVAEVSIQATEPLKKIELRVKGLKGGKAKKVTSDEVNNEDGLESQADETMEDDERKHESVEDRVKVPKGGKAKEVTSDEANNEDGLESEVVEPAAQADERMEDDERKHESVEDRVKDQSPKKIKKKLMTEQTQKVAEPAAQEDERMDDQNVVEGIEHVQETFLLLKRDMCIVSDYYMKRLAEMKENMVEPPISSSQPPNPLPSSLPPTPVISLKSPTPVPSSLHPTPVPSSLPPTPVPSQSEKIKAIEKFLRAIDKFWAGDTVTDLCDEEISKFVLMRKLNEDIPTFHLLPPELRTPVCKETKEDDNMDEGLNAVKMSASARQHNHSSEVYGPLSDEACTTAKNIGYLSSFMSQNKRLMVYVDEREKQVIDFCLFDAESFYDEK
ncbi:rho gdp-dissociation inhibitor 1 [Phtheirospermum japonicum]|uniref:Rho gdp-dissociation inhibitor 1 n=1 Tax=Phtheirospermum japonicum TaxID=374723 RepID=A0A830CVQ5_9LAMI|nr:rho gdp-dissociation inhibitor 1 [Phtheirospermum japonicum]